MFVFQTEKSHRPVSVPMFFPRVILFFVNRTHFRRYGLHYDIEGIIPQPESIFDLYYRIQYTRHNHVRVQYLPALYLQYDTARVLPTGRSTTCSIHIYIDIQYLNRNHVRDIMSAQYLAYFNTSY